METSSFTMETLKEKQKVNNNGQLILVPHKDTIRLLEVYVKRSLSLNDGALASKRPEKKEKWVTMPQKHRRHSSDPSIHLNDGFGEGDIAKFTSVEPQANLPGTAPEEKEKQKNKLKKVKKPSLWKSFLGMFSRKDAEDKDDEQETPAEMPETSENNETFETTTSCLPTTAAASVQRKKSVKRRSKKKRLSRTLSFLKSNKLEDLNSSDISAVESVVSVEPTYSYYEKMTEELEKIVNEVKEKEEAKPLTDEEVINRIIALTKEQGDAIDGKIKDNPTLSNFFQGMSYSSFQQLADAYLEKETTPTQNPPTVLSTAPELVKLAFTFDFTARIAGLSKQNIGHITGLGNRYLQDRFEYKQACTDHPWSDCDD